MRTARCSLVAITVAVCVLAPRADSQADAPATIASAQTAVRAATDDGACVGFDVFAVAGDSETSVAEVRWTSEARFVCDPPEIRTEGRSRSLVFRGFRAPGGPSIGHESAVVVSLGGDDPFPSVQFALKVLAFDPETWPGFSGSPCPFYFLRCSLPGAASPRQLMYQGGELYPGPQVDPYPITMGPMRGLWAENWSYAPALWAHPVPAVGLWAPDDKLFAAFEFQQDRSTDQAAADLASTYCAGQPGHPGQFVCLAYSALSDWLGLVLPEAPFWMQGQFRILHSTDMPSDSDPNRFVLRELTDHYRDLLPPAPQMNDMSWVRQGREASQLLFLEDIGEPVAAPRTGVAPLLFAPWERSEKTWFAPGATQLAGHMTAKSSRYAWLVGDRDGLAAQKEQLDYLLTRAKREVLGGDECLVWDHPLDGTFRADFGAERATSTRHMFNWAIASAMLHWYRNEGTREYLPVIDGMVKWTRHYLYDRAGMADLPWAVFSMGAANGGEFLLDYYYTFRDDPERRDLAAEAFRLAEVVVYRNIYPYLSDPDARNAMDPTFLLQAVNSHYWLGMVTWGEMSRVPEMAIQLYLETGDPFFEHLARGALERWHIGTANSAGEYAENVRTDTLLGPWGPGKGWGGNTFRWLAEPLGSAICQVDVGPKGAMAFCRGTRAVDIRDYAFRPETSFGFTVAVDAKAFAAPEGPFDIQVTAPRRDLRGATVSVNGQTLPPRRFVIGTAGTDMLVRGVHDGDRVTINEVGEADRIELRHYKQRAAFDPKPSDAFECVDLTALAGAEVDTTWSGPWGGLIPGPQAANGVEFCLIDPERNGRKGAVDVYREGAQIDLRRPGPVALVWGLPMRPEDGRSVAHLGGVSVLYADGRQATYELTTEEALPIAYGREWYGKRWVLYHAAVGEAGQDVRSLSFLGNGLLFAITTPKRGEWRGEAAIGTMVAEIARKRRAASYASYPGFRAKPDVADTEWRDESLPFRFLLTLDGGGIGRIDALPRIREAFDAVLPGEAGGKTPSRVRAFEVDDRGRSVGEVPAQFDPSPANPARGDMLLSLPGEWPGGVRRFWIYFGPGPQEAAPSLSCEVGERVEFSSGRISGTFDLSGGGPGPRLVDLRFADGPNVLAKAGWDEGFGHLCACNDAGDSWYDFGALQTTAARAEVVNAGPVALTCRVSGLSIYGAGTERVVDAVGSPGRTGVAEKGECDWYFRLYANDQRIDSWVDAFMTDTATGWTRPLEARFGLTNTAAARTVAERPDRSAFAQAGPLAIVSLSPETGRPAARPNFTGEDGAVLSVLMLSGADAGWSTSGAWRIMPSGAGEDRYASEGQPFGVTQSAVERWDGERAVPMRRGRRDIIEQPRPVDWARLLPFPTLATFTAGEGLDDTHGLSNRDNPDEGRSRRGQVSERWCLVPGTAPAGGQQTFFYFDVDDALVGGHDAFAAAIAIEYLDRGGGQMALEYDSADETVQKAAGLPGAFKEVPSRITLADTGEWRTFVCRIPDARFANRCNGADFRLQAYGPSPVVARIAVGLP